MRFTKAVLAQCCSLLVVLLLAGCSSTAEKQNADGAKPEKHASKSKHDDKESAVPIPTGPVVSILPPGPVLPNPYLLTKPKVSDQVDANFRDAIAAIQQKNWSHAETVLQQLATANPTLSGVQLNLGLVYRGKGELDKAADAFNRAITINAKNVDAYTQLAVLKREAGDFAAAESLYQRALAVWPFYPEGHKNLAILYELYLGKPEQALPHYQAYQQLLPAPDKQVDSWIADLQRRLNGGKDAAKAPAKPEEK